AGECRQLLGTGGEPADGEEVVGRRSTRSPSVASRHRIDAGRRAVFELDGRRATAGGGEASAGARRRRGAYASLAILLRGGGLHAAAPGGVRPRAIYMRDRCGESASAGD